MEPGHGPLNRHDRVEPTCQAEEVSNTDLRRLFCIRGRKQEHNSDRIVLRRRIGSWAEGYLSDMTGHWQVWCLESPAIRKRCIRWRGHHRTGVRSVPSAVMRSHRRSLSPVTTMTMMTTMTAVRRPIRTEGHGRGNRPATPATPRCGKAFCNSRAPDNTAADENSKRKMMRPPGRHRTRRNVEKHRREERIDSVTAQTSDSQESGTEQITETSGR